MGDQERVRKWKEGSIYECILSKSPGYRYGELYKCTKDPERGLVLTGSDGFVDPVGMLVSGFVEIGTRAELSEVIIDV
jgi:hypothetical protein